MVYCASKLIDSVRSRRWEINRSKKERARAREKLVNHSLSARDLQAFLVFSQHPAWVITLVNS